MITEREMDAAVRQLFENITFTAEPAGLYDPLRYMIGIGGKRLRPRLCLLAYSLFRDGLSEDVLNAAAALEVFHSFTLIHDDIMDRSPMRRACPTVWKKWNEDTAILSGDVMLIDAYRRMATLGTPAHQEALALFTRTAAEVCEGQQYDMEFEQVPQVPMEGYLRMIGLKTAVLLACSAKMGALIAGAPSAFADSLYEYGYQLGLAFQVADDYLDTYGDASVFGKPIGGDIVNNKKSWLLTRAFEKAGDAGELLAAMDMPVETEEQRCAKVAAVKAIYDALGVGQDARDEISRLTGLAMDAVENLRVGKLRLEELRRFADSLVGRAK